MKFKKVILIITSVLLLLAVVLAPHRSAVKADASGSLTWTFVSIPGLPTGSVAQWLWTDGPGNLYVWTSNTIPGSNNVPRAVLYHWDGVGWTMPLSLDGFGPSSVFGTGPQDVYAAAFGCDVWDAQSGCLSSNRSAMYHFDGSSWVEQALPPQASSNHIHHITGFPGDVYASVLYYLIIRNTGSGWTTVYTSPYTQCYNLTMLSPTDGYFTGCAGHGWGSGTTWTEKGEFHFCDVYDIWGIRDAANQLHLYTVGNNNFSNGVRVWKYNEAAHSFGCPTCYAFADPPYSVYDIGSAYGIWGSSASDVYVVGRYGPWGQPGSGRVYHFDGTIWQRLIDFGDIWVANDVWGSGPDDVWVSMIDGRLLHYGPRPVQIDIKPGSEPNCFNNNGHGVIPVAILGSNEFDVAQVDPTSISLDGQGVRVTGRANLQAHLEDSNGDGYIDLVVQIEDIDGTYLEGDTLAILDGTTYAGEAIRGMDRICIVP